MVAAQSADAAPSYTKTRLNGGMTGAQEHALGEKYKAKLPGAAKVAVSAKSASGWTAAEARTAINKAKYWLGAPYSWAGGTRSGPSNGYCETSDAGVFDCHVWGFDCSGLVLYSWGPYLNLDHYAATQYNQAGAYHPTADTLQPGDLLFFSSNGKVSGIHHVQMYIGGGKVIEAPMSGYTVRIVKLNLGGQYYGATRPASKPAQIAPPAISRLSTQYSTLAGGGTVTIYGQNLGAVSKVTIGGKSVKFSIVSGGRVRATVPAGTEGTVDVRLTNLWGVSAVTTADKISYVTSKPVVYGLARTSGPTSGGSTVAIYATGLGAAPTITVGGAPVTGLKQISPYKYTFQVPKHAAGRVSVRVSTPLGTSVISAKSTYTYTG